MVEVVLPVLQDIVELRRDQLAKTFDRTAAVHVQKSREVSQPRICSIRSLYKMGIIVAIVRIHGLARIDVVCLAAIHDDPGNPARQATVMREQ